MEMADLFAFNVAVSPVDPEPGELGFYDADTQQFVWAANGEVTLGMALCTGGPTGWRTCKSTGTTCNKTGSGCTNPGFIYCYVCDYG